MPPPEDVVRLAHLREAGEKALRYSQGTSRKALEEDEILRLALTKLVEIVGEAAKQVSEPTRRAHPSVPGQRRLACATAWSITTSTSTWTCSGRRLRLISRLFLLRSHVRTTVLLEFVIT